MGDEKSEKTTKKAVATKKKAVSTNNTKVTKKSVKLSSDSDSSEKEEEGEEDEKSKQRQKTSNKNMKNNKKVISSKGKKKTKNHTVSTSAKDKVKAAKARLKQMQKSGALQAPPRRAASLSAAAMVHFMYDNEQVPAKTGNLNNAKNTASPGSTSTTPENVQKAKSRDSSEEKMLSAKKPKTAEKSRQVTASDSF